MPRATCFLLAVVAAAGPALAQPGSPPVHVDPEAAREARGVERSASSWAIGHYLEAQSLEREGDWRGAAAELELAVAFDDRSPDLRVALAEALALSGELRRAEVEARRAVDLSRGAGPAASRGHVLLAQCAAASRDPVRAVEELRQAVEVEEKLAAAGQDLDPEPWRLLALADLELGDEAAAQLVLEELATRVPGDGTAYREAGRLLLERREAGRAERYLRRAVELSRQDLAAWRLLARAHRALGRSPEVTDDLRAILQLEPEDPEALHGLGVAALEADDAAAARGWLDRYLGAVPADAVGAAARVAGEWLEAGRAEEALACVRRAQAEAGKDPRLRLAEGTALARLGRLAEAARTLGQVAEEDEEWVAARVELAGVLSRAGRHAEAARALDGALARQPQDEKLMVARARALEWAGRPRQGVALLERAERERGRDAEAEEELVAARGELLRRSGRPAEAVAALEAPAAAQPRSARLRVALARALAEAGATDRATAELRGLLVVQPESVEGLALLSRLLAGDGGRLPEAEELARRAVDLRPGWPPGLAALGRVLSARGDHAGAAAVLLRAVQRSGGQAPYLEDLGDARRAAGLRAEAVEAWRRALAAAADLAPGEAERLRSALRQKLRAARAAGGRGGATRLDGVR